MTILFMDGFDWLSGYGNIVRKWDAYAIGDDFSTNYARFPGGRGGQFNNSVYYLTKFLTVDTYSTITFGIAFYINSAVAPTYGSSNPFISFRDKNNVSQVNFFFEGYDFTARQGDGTLLGTASSMAVPYTWYYLQCKAYIHDTAGTVRVDLGGSTVLDLTSKDTRNGTAYIDRVRLACIYNALSTRFDDAYITDGDILGECRIKSYFPDSDETHTDFTLSAGSDHYAMVDETTPDDDSTYAQSSVLNAKDSYGITPSISGNVEAIQLHHMVKKTGVLDVNVKSLIRSGGSDYNSTEENTLTSSYKVFTSIHETDPQDSNPWTEAKITAAEFGLQITGITTTTTT